MKTNNKTARMIGVLFIIGTAAGVLSVPLITPVLESPDYLAQISANGNQIVLGALMTLVMGLALAMIPVLMYPIAKKQNEILAVGYVVFRGALETVTYLAIVMGWLLLLPLSQAYVQAEAANVATLQALGALLVEETQISAMLTAVIFPLGALMFYTLLYQTRLIPRWLSVWGLLAATVHLFAMGLAGMFGLLDSMPTLQVVLFMPIFLQEMVMAVWLIVKGFNVATVNTGPAALASYNV